MRFLVDMNIATDVAVWLRGQGHDAVHLREVGLQELRDEAVLAKAVAEKRVVLTFDLDFADLAAAAGDARAAVILMRLRSARRQRESSIGFEISSRLQPRPWRPAPSSSSKKNGRGSAAFRLAAETQLASHS